MNIQSSQTRLISRHSRNISFDCIFILVFYFGAIVRWRKVYHRHDCWRSTFTYCGWDCHPDDTVSMAKRRCASVNANASIIIARWRWRQHSIPLPEPFWYRVHTSSMGQHCTIGYYPITVGQDQRPHRGGAGGAEFMVLMCVCGDETGDRGIAGSFTLQIWNH